MPNRLGSSRPVSPLVKTPRAPSTRHASPSPSPSPPRPEQEPLRVQDEPPRSPPGPLLLSKTSETVAGPEIAAVVVPDQLASPPSLSSRSPSAPSLSATQKPTKPIHHSTPQLSERDDIFATHYLAADSGANTPNFPAHGRLGKGDTANQDVAVSESLPGPLSSRARQSSSLHHTSSNPTQPALPPKMHMAPEAAPYSSSSPAPPVSRDGAYKLPADDAVAPPPPQEAGLDKENWDRAREKDKSRPNARRHRSDEQIQATLANEEPIGHARSRKASHYLGLFRENAKEKQQQREQRDSRDRAREAYGIGQESDQDNAVVVEEGAGFDNARVDDGRTENDATGPALPQLDTLRSLFTSTKSEDPVALLSPDEETDEPMLVAPEQNVEWFSEGAPSGAYPIRLLEEIRAHPVAQQHVKEKRKDSSPAAPQLGAQPKPPVLTPQAEHPSDDNDAEALLTLPPDAEDDDSDKEHISAATYFPHQAPSPDDIQGQNKPGKTYNDIGDPAISPQTTPLPVPAPTQPAVGPDLDFQTSRAVDKDERGRAAASTIVDNVQPGPLRRVDTGLSIVSEAEYESPDDDVDDLDELADVDHTPTTTPRIRPTKITKKGRRSRSPLGAVELKPYKHQVGGHTKVFSFSKQAICKELNNKENQFYEVIERRHPELLDFMPRYLGVLNVTYTKAKRKQQPAAESQSHDDKPADTNGEPAGEAPTNPQPQERVISHSKNFSAHDESIPRVVFANNMHIIPSNLFPSPPSADGSIRPSTASGAIDRAAVNGLNGQTSKGSSESGEPERQTSLSSLRPSLKDLPIWGATTVNYKLKERVLRDVFSPPVVYPKHNRRVRKPLSPESRDEKLSRSESQLQRRTANKDELLSAALLKSASDLTSISSNEHGRWGVSAPTHHSSYADLRDRTSVDSNASEPTVPLERHISRRRSDQGLQRLQCDIDTGERSDLSYFEDDDLAKSKSDDIFAMDMQNGHKEGEHETKHEPDYDSTLVPFRTDSTQIYESRVENPSPLTQQIVHYPSRPRTPPMSPISIPVNPLQAQLNSDERVRHFLLLEDLTANMVKPCVLDLKMGTRQYGIEANQKKRTSQRMKCKMTTSRQLGVRVCGMQVWNVKKQEYAFEDKYAGRDLRAGREFQAALRRFLYDGVSPTSVTRHIPVLLDKLSRLEQIVSQLPRYRFYASSLLMIYDGADIPSQKNMDRGGKTESETADQPDMDPIDKSKGPNATGGEREKPMVSDIDIRLVDFANCVTSQTKRLADAPSPPRNPNQPDRGYIKGLRSLRSYLQRIWMEINTEEAGSWVERGEGEAMAIAQQGAGNADQPDGWRKAGEAVPDEGEVSE